MKKISVALLGLFTLVACSEDAYQEADKLTETGSVENNSGGTMMPMTVSIGYNSPFQPYGSPSNKGFTTTFTNNTPLHLNLQPYGEDMHVQTFLSANMIYPPYSPGILASLNPIAGSNFNVMAGTVETNSDTGAPLAVNAPPYTASTGSVIYDFGSWSPNWRMYHYGNLLF